MKQITSSVQFGLQFGLRSGLLIALFATLVACGSTSPNESFPEGYARTPDDLRQLLRLAFDGEDSLQLARTLHPDFIFRLDPADVDTLGIGPDLPRDSVLCWAASMFRREAGWRAYGSWQPPLDAVRPIGSTWLGGGEWPMVEGQPEARSDTLRAIVSADYSNADFDLIQSDGLVQIQQVELALPGAPKAWQMVFWEDVRGDRPQTARGPGHSLSFGRWFVKFRFNNPENPDS